MMVSYSCEPPATQQQAVLSDQDTIMNDQDTAIINTKVAKSLRTRFLHFPIPKLDSLLPYDVTSGMVGKVRQRYTKRYYHPADSGIFVAYSLLEKKNYNGKLVLVHDDQPTKSANLITHTYFKQPYGWSTEDQDQTFIGLYSDSQFFGISESIRVGSSRDQIEKAVGFPVIIEDSTRIYLGSNGIIGEVTYQNNVVTKFNYFRYSIEDSIFELQGDQLQSAIREKIK